MIHRHRDWRQQRKIFWKYSCCKRASIICITHCSAGRLCAHLPVIRGDLSAAHYLAACKCPQHSGVTWPQPQDHTFAGNCCLLKEDELNVLAHFSNPEYHKLSLNTFLPTGKAIAIDTWTVFGVSFSQWPIRHQRDNDQQNMAINVWKPTKCFATGCFEN